MTYRKYNNKKCGIDGHTFDSMHEAKRYLELKAMQQEGLIFGLELQVPYVLAEAKDWKKPFMKKGRLNKKMRACTYIADFRYSLPNGEVVVEDAKGMETKEYKVKKKWMYEKFGIQIMEV